MSGISFIVRVRNEEATLEESLKSLRTLTIPHDIHVILNLCTDRSRSIAESLQKEGMPIHIHDYDFPLSRPGYETLITDAVSKHSFVEHSRWCYSKATYPWRFRWDADFVASHALTDYLNGEDWKSRNNPTQIRITYVSPDATNAEAYLFCGDYKVIKYIFWEYCDVKPEPDVITLPSEVSIQHKSVFSDPKSYWREPCWFWPCASSEAGDIRRRYHALVSVCGPEPQAQARASNPESANVFCKVRDNESVLNSLGIHFWE